MASALICQDIRIFDIANLHEFGHEFHEFILPAVEARSPLRRPTGEASFPRSDLGKIKNQRPKTKKHKLKI